jgi:hypothetical protein
MTSTLSPDAGCARRCPRHSVTAVDPAVLGSSRGHTRVSQQRDGCLQIQSSWPECHVQRAMIGVMHEPPDHLLTDCSPDISGYTSAYRCSYTVVYTEAKEVSRW